ncbi:MAG: hypothetical protein KatS3mg129_1053 [Leptospiraceae bacterium]|nr:MAG: hypothetical protein KatS3mg129_1053 [Leptospiraceae bacterium]
MVEFIEGQHYRQILQYIEDEFLVSKTNKKGIITYVNDKFCEVSGYTKEELIGKPHNIVRHPDMPKEVFRELWHTIKTEKRPWSGFIKNKRKDGTHYWVLSTIVPIFDEENKEEIVGFLSIRKEITELMDNYELNEMYAKLYKILDFYNKHPELTLKEILSYALEEILTFRWLEIQNKGGIFLYNDESQQLEMFVHKGVGESLLKLCNRVDLNQCLCGKAAFLKQIIFKSHVDDDHENHPQGMQPHGHYNLPLMFNNQLLGVLFLYVEDGYSKREIEMKFFQLLSFVLGSIIYKYKLEEDLKKMNLKNFLFLQHLKRFSSKDTYNFSKNMISTINGSSNRELFYSEKYLYLLFLDIVNFTGFSENKKPIEVKEAINTLFSEFVNIIYKNKGDIDKFIGDAIFCYFEDPDNTIKSAIEILELLQNPEKNPHKLQVRIGIHCGNVVHTEIGNDLRSDYTLIGDAVNTTQRLERAAKANQILVSKEFLDRVSSEQKETLEISKKYSLKAKNKSQLIPVFYIQPKKNVLHG